MSGKITTNISSSRAMAVAAREGRAYVYVLKSMDEMRAEFKEKSRLEPIREVCIRSFSLCNFSADESSYCRKSSSCLTEAS